MKALLFNVHDVALLLMIVASVLLGVSYFANTRMAARVRPVFAFFFIAYGLVAASTLVYWGEGVRDRVFDVFPVIFLLLSPFTFLLGPLLYFQVRMVYEPKYSFKLIHGLHLLPVVFAPVYLYFVCFQYDIATQRELFLGLGLYHQSGIYYLQFISLEKLAPVFYSAWYLRFVFNRKKSNVARNGLQVVNRDHNRLVLVLVFIWLWIAVIHFAGVISPGNYVDVLGIAGNYFKFSLVLYLFYCELPFLIAPRTVSTQESVAEQKKAPNEEHIDRVLSAMSEQKVFLNSQITLERFADITGLTPREVSTVINRKFEQNFQEFVNRYRIEEAKLRLVDPAYTGETITDIAQASGFNSKATFNRFFKKFVLTTPSSYRQKHQLHEAV